MIFTFRMMFLAVLVSCLGMLGFGLYLQHGLHLEPCPLCVVQRIGFVVVALTALVAFVHNPGSIGRKVYGFLLMLFSGAGAAVAIRNLWLQSLPPDQVPECGPGLDYLLDTFPLTKVLPMVFKGSGECAKVEWTMFGLAIPAWALLGFAVFFAAGLAALLLRERKRG